MYWQFRDESQQAQAIRALFERANAPSLPGSLIAGLSTQARKPSEAFFQMFEHAGTLSHGEQILLRLALDIWNAQGKVLLAELFDLDERNRALALLNAISTVTHNLTSIT
jgi:hypothetical protein